MKKERPFCIDNLPGVYCEAEQFNQRSYEMLQHYSSLGMHYICIDVSAHLDNGTLITSAAIDPRLLDLSSLQQKGLIRERILSASEREHYLREAFRNHGLDERTAAYCFLEGTRIDTLFASFERKYGQDWHSWPEEFRDYPLSYKTDLKDLEDEILLGGYVQCELDGQWSAFCRQAAASHLHLLRPVSVSPDQKSGEAWMYQQYYVGGKWKPDDESIRIIRDTLLSASQHCDGIVLEDFEKLPEENSFRERLLETIRKNKPELMLACRDEELCKKYHLKFTNENALL